MYALQQLDLPVAFMFVKLNYFAGNNHEHKKSVKDLLKPLEGVFWVYSNMFDVESDE